MSGFGSLNSSEPEQYDNYVAGVVVDNNDPEKLQRVKVQVPNLLEAPAADLPWVAPLVYSPFVLCVPHIGDRVAVYFQKGDIHYGLSEGYLHDVNKEVPAEILENYPHRRGWWDPFGNLFYTDSSTGHRVYKHKDNVFTEVIDSNGNVTIHAEENVAVTIGGNVSVIIDGNANVVVNGATTLNSQGNVVITSDGSITMQADTINLN